MEYEYGGEHAEDVAQADHRVGHAERIFLEDIHPQHRPAGVADAATEEPPVDKKAPEEPEGPFELSHLLEGELEQDLASRQEEALDDGQCQQSPHGFLRYTNPTLSLASFTTSTDEYLPAAIKWAAA